jgi:hypothetical protein
VLVDEVEAGTRTLSPGMKDALARELMRDDDVEYKPLNQAAWDTAWGKEIERRLAKHRAGKAVTHKFAEVIAELRARR